VSPAPSMAFDRHRPGLRGFPGTRAAHRPKPVRGSPRGLASPSKRSKTAGFGSRRPLLSWDSSKSCPSADMPLARQLQEKPEPLHRSSGYPPPDPVPPSWFLPTSTVSSARRSRVCCTPQPDKGSSRFTLTGARTSGPSEDGPGRDAPSGAPRDAVHTLRSLPSVDSRAASLRPLPPCRYRPAGAGRRFELGEAPIRRSGPPRHRERRTRLGWVDPEPGSIESAGADGMRVRRTIAERIGFEALLRRQSPLSSGRRCRRPTLVPSMGFVPLRGSSCVRSLQRHRGEAVWLAAPHVGGVAGPAVPGRRHLEARGFEERTRRRAPRPKPKHETNGSPGSLSGFTHGARPPPVVAAARGRPKPGYGPAPFQRGRP
jgi:hypothetical protein